MNISTKTKIIDIAPSPIRTFYDEDIDFPMLNEINKKVRDIDEDKENIENMEENIQEEIDVI